MQQAGQMLLEAHKIKQYEVSAYATSKENQCQHNLNYWTFGDYLGIGAGAHAKITTLKNFEKENLREKPENNLNTLNTPKYCARRFSKIRYPKSYLEANSKKQPTENTVRTIIDNNIASPFVAENLAGTRLISTSELTFEFMLNALRLSKGFSTTLYYERTGLKISAIQKVLDNAISKGLLENQNASHFIPTDLGKRFLNDLVALFLD